MPGKKASEEVRREQIVQAAFRVATREGLEQLTMRQVAAEARLSNGLVFFHFKSKEALLLALFDWLLVSLFETWHVPENLPPAERLLAWLQFDLQDLSQDEQGRDRLRLFLSYWPLATHDPVIDERMKDALERSRQTLLPVVQAVIESEPRRFRQVTPEGLVSVVLAMTQGSAMQSLLSNHCVDAEQILSVIRALLLPSSPGEKGR
ncbi:MAG: TetR family transcriptional regulator [Ktedonobacteraceae bacterium]|nr:TetR family transcriptional regulator [Ktedonobacteraceae bacterium]